MRRCRASIAGKRFLRLLQDEATEASSLLALPAKAISSFLSALVRLSIGGGLLVHHDLRMLWPGRGGLLLATEDVGDEGSRIDEDRATVDAGG